ncbi:ABC transporter permease [Ulvibacterium sp.]|uniref:ABC transporter permease n=1 Tax=Ulvibacterium sp. TaxID=2665914 RepID=UPI003BAA981A
MFKNYLKIAWRSLRKRKGFAVINVLGLALGFGTAVLVFLFVNHHLQFDTFHHNSDRIYRFVTEEHHGTVYYSPSVPPGFANAFKADYDYADKLAKIANWNNEVIFIEETNLKIKLDEDIAFTEPDFFKIFNFPLVDGSNDVDISIPNTAVVTQSMARKLFGSQNPINKTFVLGNKETITITGILKDLPSTSLVQRDMFISFETLKKYQDFLGNESWGGISSSLQSFALLHPDQDIAQIEEVLSGYVTKFRPDDKNVHHYKLQSLADIHFNSKYSGGVDVKILWIFSLIGLFILVVASINFINISTAQSITRSKEVGVRKVLGSFKGQLFGQFMTETFMITCFALVLGILLSIASLPYFNTLFNLRLSNTDLLQWPFLVFGLLILVGITLLAGSYPGILLARITPISALKRKLNQKDSGGYFTRKVLVTMQFSISILLIIGAIVISKQIQFAINSDLGFDRSSVVMVRIPEEPKSTKIKGIKERIASFSGVEKITACFAPPGAAINRWGTSLSYNNNPEGEEFSIQAKIADKDYLNTFDLRLLAGRNFYEKDSVDEVLVNEAFVRKIGASSLDEVLGKPLTLAGGYIKADIVGVIADFHDRDFHQDINPIFIAPQTGDYSELAIKINMDQARESLQHIEKEWSALFPNHIFEYDFLDDRVAELYETEQRFLSLIQIFSGMAIFIGLLGIYGLILFFVVQKTKEIGIRKVLGSSVLGILWLITQDFLKLILIAGVIASPVAWYFMGNWLENFTYRTEISWWVYGMAIGSLLLITLFTVSYQALKAARANPVKSLRTE